MSYLHSPKSEALAENSRGYLEFVQALHSIKPEMNYFGQKILKNFISDPVRRRNFTWLDVGGGLGDPTVPILDYLERLSGIRLEYTLLDYMSSIVQQFLHRIDYKVYQNIQIQTALSRWEDYSTRLKYDIVSFIHVIYYTGDLSKTILKSLDMIDDDGYIFVANLGLLPGGVESDYSKIYKKIYGVSPTNIFEIANEFEHQGGFIDPPTIEIRVLDLFQIRSEDQERYKRVIAFLSDRPFSLEDEEIVLSVATNGKLVFPLGMMVVRKNLY
jgi:2-polyprenyl-3-methyl-5-hydroxy-6-metoxy-1,4-benzoquinol methylase